MNQANNLLYANMMREKHGWDKQDYERALQVQQVISMPGWKVIKSMLAMQRESMLYSSRSIQEPNAAFAVLKKIEGFDLACNITAKILQEAENRIKAERTKIENEKVLEEK